MRVRGKSRYSPRASKRKYETESNSIAAYEPRPKRGVRRSENEQRESSSPIAPNSDLPSNNTGSPNKNADKYCWLCHTETDEKICVTCPRAYHNSCLEKKSALFDELGVCPECLCKSVDGTEWTSNRFFNPDKFKRMLDALTRRSFDKKRDKKEIFLRWPEKDRDKLAKVVDFEILLDNINHFTPYTNTADFYGDVKFIFHNSLIAYGANSDQAKTAENLRRDFKTELLDLEACPECYYHLYCDEYDSCDRFIRICAPPHDIVWAKLTGHSYWPAKCLKVVKGLAHVRFFGEHERSNIPINKCFFMSESHPKDPKSNIWNPANSGVKSPSFQSARAELLKYINLYSRKYGAFPFYPHKTLYKPQEKQNEVIITSAEGSCNRNLAQMKLEGIANEDSEANVSDGNATTVMGFFGDNMNFPNSVTNDITSSNGQYPTLDDLLPSIIVNPTPLTSVSVESNLNNNSSPVTSINMSFSSDENPSNVGNLQKNPVVTAIESLQSTESPPIALSSSVDTSLECQFRFLENFKGIFHPESSKVTETVPCAEFISTTISNNVAEHSPIHSDSSCNIISNFSEVTEDQAELDGEVQFIGQKRKTEEDDSFNPDIVLPVLLEGNPELKSLVQKARYLSDGMIIHLWASLCKSPISIGKLSKMCVDLRKCRTDLKQVKLENDRIKKEVTENKSRTQSLKNELEKLQSDNTALQKRVLLEKEKRNEARDNAKAIIRSLKTGCSKKIEEMLRSQFMEAINEKEEKLQDAEKTIKSLEEAKRQLEKELEEVKVAKQILEDKQKFTLANPRKVIVDADEIRKFKTNHYCCVCEKSASVVCCLNTSYCEKSRCRMEHADEHRSLCRKEKMASRSIVQQTTVHEQTVLFSVNMKGRSTSTSQDVSDIGSMGGSIHQMNEMQSQIHHVPALPLPPTQHQGAPSPSRSYTPKGKRRSCR